MIMGIVIWGVTKLKPRFFQIDYDHQYVYSLWIVII